MNYPISLHRVTDALNALKNISRPYGDNEGEAINSPSIYDHLSGRDRDLVDEAYSLAREFTRTSNREGEDIEDRKNLRRLREQGFEASLGQDQYDPYLLTGRISIPPLLDEDGNEVGESWVLDISDTSPHDSGY